MAIHQAGAISLAVKPTDSLEKTNVLAFSESKNLIGIKYE